MATDDKDITTFEKHGQTIIATIVLAGILFIGDKVVESTQNIAVMKVEIAHINTTLQTVSNNIYIKQQANSDLALRDSRITNIIQTTQHLDSRITKLEEY